MELQLASDKESTQVTITTLRAQVQSLRDESEKARNDATTFEAKLESLASETLESKLRREEDEKVPLLNRY